MVRLHTIGLPVSVLLSLLLPALASCAATTLKCSKNNTVRAVMSRSRTIAASSPESYASLSAMCHCLVSEGNKGASANYAACQLDAALLSYPADQIAIACVCQPVDTISITITSTTSSTTTTEATSSIKCNRDLLFRGLLQGGAAASSFCQSYTTAPATAGQAYPNYLTSYSGTPSRISSACTCISLSPAPSLSTITTTSMTSTTKNAPPAPTLKCVENNTVRQIMRVSRTIAASSSESAADLHSMCRCLVRQGNRGAAAEYDRCWINSGLSAYSPDQIASACVCQPVESIASVDTSISTPTSTYNPPAPSSYEGCMADPGNPDLVWKLLEPEHGIPLLRDGKYLKVPTEVTEGIPEFKFKKIPGLLPGTYDVVLGEEYVAVEDSGRVSFQSKSSGPDYITDNGVTFITSIFSYSCDGVLKIGLPGIIEYEFGLIDGYLYAQPIVTDLNNPLRMRRRDVATREKILQLSRLHRLNPLSMIVAPSYTIASQLGRYPRCPSRPVGLEATLKPGAPPPSSNGCGDNSFFGQFVPNYIFKPCCDEHDFCFDDCAQGFDRCNELFLSCNQIQCRLKYPSDNILTLDPLFRWGCYELADLYDFAVSSPRGADTFREGNSNRCDCNCPQYNADCGGTCTPIINTANNCGSCGNVCASGLCNFNVCYDPPPSTSEDPCDDSNMFDFEVVLVDGKDYIQSGAGYVRFTTDIKKDCCKGCHERDNCVAWQWFPIGGPDKCMHMLPSWEGTQKFGQPYPSMCPAGGNKAEFFHNENGVGLFFVEPGPCAVWEGSPFTKRRFV
ncbi:hypothetical protein TWF225_004278 [Orbilia oligospora]|nr:hypothetical protein TWF225_004278 [Orbilia oligospora]KAF3245093.1 hypothetical protein TWF128_009492 [Orbilia oligospora]KAF3272874.1 hypothetical protein TWF217_000332 [Orbilia oligospora]